MNKKQTQNQQLWKVSSLDMMKVPTSISLLLVYVIMVYSKIKPSAIPGFYYLQSPKSTNPTVYFNIARTSGMDLTHSQTEIRYKLSITLINSHVLIFLLSAPSS